VHQFYRNEKGVSYALRGDEKPECILFAEGDAEAFFLETWLKKVKKDTNLIAVICFKGHSNLEPVIKSLSGNENFPHVQRFGFLVDAEGEAASRTTNKIARILGNYSIIPKNTALVAGEQFTINGKQIAIFVSPDNNHSGYVEHVVMNEVRASQLYPCFESLKTCVEGINGNAQNVKSLVQAYLGIKRPGLCGTGRGFESGALDVMHAAYAPIRDTLSKIL
jgi:hypothetical protein